MDFTLDKGNPGGLWQCPSNNYTFSAAVPGGSTAEFFALDSNGCQGCVRYEWPDAEEDLHGYIAELGRKAKASQADWKIAFAHHPLYTAGRHHGRVARCLRLPHYRRRGQEVRGYNLEGVLVDSGVQAYFSGHEHAFQWTSARGVASFVCGASGGSHTGYYGGKDLKGDQPIWTEDSGVSGFVAASLTKDVLTVRIVDADGHVLEVVEHNR